MTLLSKSTDALNSTNAAGSETLTVSSAPTSTVINVGSGAQMDTNQSYHGAHVFYAFAEVEGYKKFAATQVTEAMMARLCIVALSRHGHAVSSGTTGSWNPF